MIKHIESLIERQETAMISAIDANGYPITKTVIAPRKREGIKVMYFTTLMTTAAVEYYKTNPKASVYFVDNSRFQSATFIGNMSVETDLEIIKEMQSNENARIFEKDFSEENYCVLRFVASSVRYMSNFNTETFEI